MQLTELNQECLLHIFSFLDKETRRSTSLTCHKLRDVFLDPTLWTLLNFSSPSELGKNNFLLSPALRSLSICWYSSRVKICNIEDWMKSNFQRDICSKHENLINNFLNQISNRCPNLVSLTLSGCGHVTDYYIIQILQKCPKLKALKLENCARMTDKVLEAVTIHGRNLRTLHVDFCRNITQVGLQTIREKCRSVFVSAERSAGMIPDNKPDETDWLGRGMKKRL
ncbi:F-box and leucine-rich protein 22 [Callorhinchus milii]|uniref:F-box and leucine-rich repeat protein 22 n=1 Tax=Callorhinchus milii TaxID=7868 RepID=V9KU02_CALMI|nr:F-box and leucine-rich protein 22 [Callorhinchus milii]|eukprot:gi/632938690/ref/XP_007905979.1/ PREDICTED: F-box and leucine-rich protein 22 [Callorhinchus milii]